MVTCKNTVPVLRDRKAYSPAYALASALSNPPALWHDRVNTWEVVDAYVLILTNYIVSQAVTAFTLGTLTTANKFAASQSLGAVAVPKGSVIPIVLGSTRILAPGDALTFAFTNNASQTGVGQVIVHLRPHDTHYASPKTLPAAL